MPEKGYFLHLTGAVLLGLVTLGMAVAAVFLLAPYLIPFFEAALPFLVGAVLIIVAVIIVWMILYVAGVVGVAIYYAIRHPMQVSKRPGTYGIGEVKEAGKREKGDSRGKEKEGE
jgi:hypothetical protein